MPDVMHGSSDMQKDEGKININTASEAELQQLPSIVTTLAKNIVEYPGKKRTF